MEGSLRPVSKQENVSSFPKSNTKVPFHQLCLLFEKMIKAKNNNLRKEEFVKFCTRWKELGKTTEEKKMNSFFPAFRLILPQLDKDRLSYGVKEKLLAKLYVEVMGLAKNGQDAKKLLDYRNPKTNLTSAGDFAEVAYQHVLSKRCIVKGNLTIAEINELLDVIAKFNNEKKKEMVKKTLLDLIKKTSGMEQKWLIRILLKDTKLRIGQKALLLAFHPDAEEVYNVSTSLKQVCDRLYDADKRLCDTEIELFQPFRPMLALHAKLEEIEQLMDHKRFSLEIKYDGERSQLHKDGNCYKYFSRSGKEYSSVFGETSFKGTLTPFIHSCFADDVSSCIIDGEMMGYNPDLKIFMQKGGQFDIKHVTEDSELQPCLIAFDLLYLNGEILTSTPQSERIRLLRKSIRPLDGRLQLAEEKSANHNQEVVSYLNEAIDRREEGIIIKNPSSVYAPNKRKGSGWFKVKPEYAAGVVDDLDLVIIGASFGSGRRGNFLSMFHLGVGVRNPTNPSEPPTKFKSLCRVGSGYTDTQLRQIIDKLKPHLKVFDKKSPPDWLEVTKERPEVYIHPEHSLVLQVKASEIIPSSAYATGCTLRFPRLVSLRDDKTFLDAFDIDRLEELKHLSDGKLAARHAKLSVDDEPVVKKRRIKVEPPPAIPSKFQAADLSSVQRTSGTFKGKTFCVISGFKSDDKQSLELRIASYGGSVVQNPVPGLFCVVARDEKNVRVANVIRSSKYNVVRVDWLLRCLDDGVISPWQPQEMIYATEESKTVFKEQYDRFGDEYDKDVTVSSLKEIFSHIGKDHLDDVLPREDAEDRPSALHHFNLSLITRYESHGFADLPTSLLSGCRIHVLHCDAAKTSLPHLVRFYGALLCRTLDDVTHVIATSSSCERNLDEVYAARRGRRMKFHIVSEKWFLDTVREGRVMDEKHYVISAT